MVFFSILLLILRVESDNEEFLGFNKYFTVLSKTYQFFLGDMSPPSTHQWLDENSQTDYMGLIAIYLILAVWVMIGYYGFIILMNFLIALIF